MSPQMTAAGSSHKPGSSVLRLAPHDSGLTLHDSAAKNQLGSSDHQCAGVEPSHEAILVKVFECR